MNTQGNPTETTKITFARSAVTAGFLALLVVGFTVSATQPPVDGVTAVTGQPDLKAIKYFPAQYVNQGKSLEEHIQAF